VNVDLVTEDHAFVEALRNGDEGAFVALVDRYHMVMLRVAARYVSGETIAEEVVQDTWIGVLRGIDRFGARSSLKTWIFTILLNQARRRGAAERRTVPFSVYSRADTAPAVDPGRFHAPGHPDAGHWIGDVIDWGQSAEEVVLGEETRAVVRRTIETLPGPQAIVMTLRDLHGWTAADVCEVLGISDANQRVRLHRARACVRRELEHYFEGRTEDD
jgi:RNA polymerase sigma-70 factor (ECF subfamily)